MTQHYINQYYKGFCRPQNRPRVGGVWFVPSVHPVAKIPCTLSNDQPLLIEFRLLWSSSSIWIPCFHLRSLIWIDSLISLRSRFLNLDFFQSQRKMSRGHFPC